MKSGRRFRVMILALLPVTWTGCVDGITWLPDSSGFIYTEQDGARLVHFDLAKGTPRTLVADTKCHTLWPAVSPDGKRIAVAQVLQEQNKPETLQVFFYGLDGAILERSKVFKIAEATKDESKDERGNPLVMAWLFWAPNDKIVISTQTETGDVVVIYDSKADRIVMVPHAHMAVFGDRPFRPDGKGFLVVKNGFLAEEEKDLGMSFVDWEGHEKSVALKLPGKEAKETLLQMLLLPGNYDSSWQGHKAIVSTSRERCEIDSDKLVGTCQVAGSDAPDLETRVRQHFDFSNGTHALRVWEWTKWEGESKNYLSRLEIVDLGQKKTSVLRENSAEPILFPSPDGKHVAVFWQNAEYNDPIIANGLLWVIDQEGKVDARLKDRRRTVHIDLSGVPVDVGPWQRPAGPLQRCLRFLMRR
jgi:hypothetical protein